MLLPLVLVLWFLAAVAAAATGLLAAIPGALRAAPIALGIVLPVVAYFTVPTLRAAVGALGLRTLTAVHIWRIGAAAAFLTFGAEGALPDAFVQNAGYGDLVAGLLALWAVFKPSVRRYWIAHLFGFADFVAAVGTGMVFTFMAPDSMALITLLPLAIIPYFGVGVSGAAHIVAFDLLRRGNAGPVASGTA
jgi:hypothetical protein